jgi:hypothetical protein
MKVILPSILLSLLSYPIAILLRLLYYYIVPTIGGAEVVLLSCVISINVVSLIIGFHAITNNKKEN